MKIIVMLSLISLSFMYCQKQYTSPWDREALDGILDTLQFGCLDTTVRTYFTGTINGQSICYGDYTKDYKTGKQFAFTQYGSIREGISTDTSGGKSPIVGYLLEFGFKRVREYAKDLVSHSLYITLPDLKPESFTTYSRFVDSTINIGNLKMRDEIGDYTNRDFNISINVSFKPSNIVKREQFLQLATKCGPSKKSGFFRCKEKIRVNNTTFAVKFDIDCDLYKCYEGRGLYFGNLVGEMVTVLKVPN